MANTKGILDNWYDSSVRLLSKSSTNKQTGWFIKLGFTEEQHSAQIKNYSTFIWIVELKLFKRRNSPPILEIRVLKFKQK